MKSQMRVVRMLPAAAAMVMAAAPVAFAQYGRSGSELFEWNGRVDREVQVVMRGGQVSTNQMSRTEGRGRSRVMTALPQRDGEVTVQLVNGRGEVDVIQQPNSQNNYTTIVRIQDPRSGSDNYQLVAYWQAYANGDVYGRNNGRARGRDRDDIYRGRNGNGNSQGNYPSNGGYYPGGVNANATMMRWSGNVDDDLEIRIQNGRLVYRVLSGKDPSSIRADQSNLNIPNGARGVSVVQNQGRGTVVVTQQPSSFNGYTTVIRIRDPQGGYGFYDFSLMWQ
jgi:redox-regulated HSP33 family molecular chaperone